MICFRGRGDSQGQKVSLVPGRREQRRGRQQRTLPAEDNADKSDFPPAEMGKPKKCRVNEKAFRDQRWIQGQNVLTRVKSRRDGLAEIRGVQRREEERPAGSFIPVRPNLSSAQMSGGHGGKCKRIIIQVKLKRK